MLRRLYSGVMILAIAGIGQSICQAQAFFPLERQVTGAVQATNVKLQTMAMAASGPWLLFDFGPVIDSDQSDPDYVSDPQSSAATVGNSVATSDGAPTAQTIPAETAWALVAESTASIGGIWSVTTGAAPAAASTDNSQRADANGDFIILLNPTYPTVTSGTLQVEFTILNAPDYDNVSISVSAGDSYLDIIQGGGSYMVGGYLEGYGVVMESGSGAYPGGVYTASQAVGVGDGFSTSASLFGQLNGGRNIADNAADGGTASISATTSVFVSTP